MSKDFGEVDHLHMRSNSGIVWNVIGSENVIEDPIMSNYSHVDPYARSPTLS